MEQGQTHRAEASSKARRNLGNPNETADGVERPGTRNVQSKLRACDLTRLQVQDIRHGSYVAARATVMQQKTQRPVQFEITEQTRESVEACIEARGLKAADFLFPSRLHTSPHLSTRQYARIVHRWVASIGLDDTAIWHPHYAPYKSLADLPPDEESSGGTAAALAYEAGKHSSLPWHRGRRCS